MAYKEDMKFQKHLSLWDWRGSVVSAHYESRRLMGPNSSWIFTCTKKNLRYITPSRSIPVIDTQKLCAGKNSIITLYLKSKPQRFDTLFFLFTIRYYKWNNMPIKLTSDLVLLLLLVERGIKSYWPLISTLLKNAQSYKHWKFQANYCACLNKKMSLSNFYLFMFLARLKTHLEGFIHLFSFYRRIKKKTTSVRVELTILRLTVARLNQLGHEVIIWFLNFRKIKQYTATRI